VDDDVPVHVLLQLRDVLGEIAAEHGRVVPLGVRQRRRDDVLGHAVELVGELTIPRRPGLGEALIGHPAQQQRLGLQGLVELELVSLVATIDLETPG